MYQQLLAEAKYYQIDNIQDLMEGYKYMQAIKIERSAQLREGVDETYRLDDPGTKVQCFPTWKDEKISFMSTPH